MSLQLILDEDFKVSADKMNFVLEKRSEVKDRKTEEIKYVWKDVGYFGRLEHLLEKYKQERIRVSESNSVDDLIEELKNIKLCINNVVKKENIAFTEMNNEPV